MLTEAQKLELVARARNALPQKDRSQGDHMDAEFAMKILLTPEVVLELLQEAMGDSFPPEPPIEDENEFD